MKHTVRSKDGELTYESFGAVEKAWLMGLIDPDDEIREDGSERWRKAGALPILRAAKRRSEGTFDGNQIALSIVGIGGGSIALYLLEIGNYLWGGVVALAVGAMVTQLVTRIIKKRKPH